MKRISMLALALLAFFIWACQKELSGDVSKQASKQQLNLFLTDDPALFDSVLIDIQAVRVRVDTCSSSGQDDNGASGNLDDDDSCEIWLNLTIRPGLYNLLQLRNGIDTLLASGSVPAGKVEKVRILIGNNSYLVKDSIRYPLHLPVGNKAEIELKMKGDDWDHFGGNSSRVWLDFDVARSIVKVRNGQFYLIPVIRPFVVKKTGVLEGKVQPMAALPVISVYNSSDTAYAIPDKNGSFKIRGLKEGSYTMFVNASNGYADTTLNNLSVLAGRETKLNTINLHK